MSSLDVELELDCAAAASALDSLGIAATAEAEWCVPGWATRATAAPPAKAPAATAPITYRVIRTRLRADSMRLGLLMSFSVPESPKPGLSPWFRFPMDSGAGRGAGEAGLQAQDRLGVELGDP